MKYKKILSLLLISTLCLSFASGCGKKEVKEEPTVEQTAEVEIAVDTPTPTVTPTATPTPTEAPKPKIDDTLLGLQKLQNENKILNSFLDELLKFQEIKMLKVYNELNVGDSHKAVLTALAKSGFRYDEEVEMITCYDDSKTPMQMGSRQGLVVFDRMLTTLEEESKNMTSTETNKYYLDLDNEENGVKVEEETAVDGEASLSMEEVTSEDTEETKTNPNVPEGATVIQENKDGSVLIEATPTPTRDYQKLDIKNPVYHSYIAFTFNKNNVLVAKFKYLERSEWYPKDLNEDIINGSLDGEVDGIELKIALSANPSTIYEKMDEVRQRIEENEANIDKLSANYVPKFTEFYNSINEESHLKTIKDTCEEKGYTIEKMNKTSLGALNARFQRDYTEGYFIGLTIDESKESPDLRFNDVYITILFNGDNLMYYKALNTPDSSDEQCKDILDINDFDLNDIYNNIVNLNKELEEYENQRRYFTEYIDKNIALFNSKIEFNETKDYLINEAQKAGLEYEEDYNNLIVTKFRNADNLDVLAFKDNGDAVYDECVLVKGGTKDIYLFFKDNIILGIYRSDYFDISEVVTSTYANLATVNTGLKSLDKEMQIKKQELAQYENMLETRLSTFRANIGYSTNHKDNQIYTKQDILSALKLGGFSYDEGMNKMDGLYYIGVRKNPTDLDYSFKIYFNQKEEVETIQDL